MINIEKFIAIRKKKKLSQSELAQGICTQATLSHFENNGQVPTFKILKRLCGRLHIEIGDIALSSRNNPLTVTLNRAEKAFLTDDYYTVSDLLLSIDQKSLTRLRDQFHFLYLQGLYSLRARHDPMHAAYFFNMILANKNLKADSIYRFLALAGLGQTHEQENNAAKAKSSYDHLERKALVPNPDDDLSSLRIIAILFYAGDFYGKNGSFEKSAAFLRQAYNLGRNTHTDFYMASVLFRLGNNDVKQRRIRTVTYQRLHDACAFARFNHDQMNLVRSRKLLNKINDSL